MADAVAVTDMNETAPSTNRSASWESWQVYVMAAICLVIGVLVGYLVRGSQGTAPADVPAFLSYYGRFVTEADAELG